MNAVNLTSDRAGLRKAIRALSLITAIFILIGIIGLDQTDEIFGYLLIVIASVFPSWLWIGQRAVDIPIMPAIGFMHYVFYGLPIVNNRAEIVGYLPENILNASITVSLFLFVATMVWRITGWVWTSPKKSTVKEAAQASQLVSWIYGGLITGFLFHTALISGYLTWLGPTFGIVRTIIVMFTTVACYFLGVAIAKKVIKGRRLFVLSIILILIILISWGSLFLIGGIMYFLSAILGYLISSKRIPWLLLGGMFLFLTVLHAGKPEMREKYWEPNTNVGGAKSLTEIPEFMIEWTEVGINSLTAGAERQSFFERASLLRFLLMAERLTPDYVEYLDGKSYTMLADMLVPRVISPDKLESQASMDMLNIRYGVVSAYQKVTTAIGWGLIAEAYANHGRWAVILVALVFGILVGIINHFTINAPAVSLPSLLGIAAMVNLINLEAVFANLFMNLWVSAIAVFIFYWAFSFLLNQRKNKS